MIYLGADHGGYELKERLKEWLEEWGYRYKDCGAHKYVATDDYPDFARSVSAKVQTCEGDRNNTGIVVCRNGVGVSVVANKFSGVRCALGFDAKQIKFARLDDDANVLALPADYLTNNSAESIVKTFLETEFSGAERHVRRLNKIRNLEEKIQNPKSKIQNKS